MTTPSGGERLGVRRGVWRKRSMLIKPSHDSRRVDVPRGSAWEDRSRPGSLDREASTGARPHVDGGGGRRQGGCVPVTQVGGGGTPSSVRHLCPPPSYPRSSQSRPDSPCRVEDRDSDPSGRRVPNGMSVPRPTGNRSTGRDPVVVPDLFLDVAPRIYS